MAAIAKRTGDGRSVGCAAETVEELLRARADVGRGDQFGKTPLRWVQDGEVVPYEGKRRENARRARSSLPTSLSL